MSFYRIGLAALTGLFATVMAEAAFAGCGGCGGYAVTYAAYPPAQLVYAAPPVQPVVLAPAPAPVAIAAAPIYVNNWDTNGWGAWGGCGCNHGDVLAYAQPLVPAATPFYVVNQGPEYSGPGVMIPFGTYSPQAGLAVPGEYPYIGGYGMGYGGYPGYGMGYGGYPGYGYGRRYGYGGHPGYGYGGYPRYAYGRHHYYSHRHW